MRAEALPRKFEKLPGTLGKLDAAPDTKARGYRSERPHPSG